MHPCNAGALLAIKTTDFTDITLSEKDRHNRICVTWFHFYETITKGNPIYSSGNRSVIFWGCLVRRLAAKR